MRKKKREIEYSERRKEQSTIKPRERQTHEKKDVEG